MKLLIVAGISALIISSLSGCYRKVEAAVPGVATSYIGNVNQMNGSDSSVDLHVVDLPTGEHCVVAVGFRSVGLDCKFKN